MPAPAEATRISRRSAALVVAVLTVAWTVAAVARLDPRAVGLFHDDGLYVATARSLAEHGTYRIESLPGAPAQTKYPPLLPLLLAPVWLFSPAFPANAIGFQLVEVAFGAMLLPLGYLAARRLFGLDRGAALSVPLLLSLSVWLLALPRWVLAELPFAAVSIATLLVARNAVRDGVRTRSVAAAGLLAAAALLLKAHGVALALAVVAGFLVARRYRAALTFVASALPLPAAWSVWKFVHESPATTPLVDYYLSYRSSFFPVASVTDLAPTLRAVAVNFVQALSSLGIAIALPGSFPAGLRAVVVGGLLGAGLAFAWRRADRSTVLFVVAYFAITIAVPWAPKRYVLPLAPLALAAFALAVRALTGRRRIAATALLVAATALASSRLVGEVRSFDAAALPAYDEWSDPTAGWSGFAETADWIVRHTAPDDVVASGLDPFYYLRSGRRGIRFSRHRPATYFYPDARSARPDVGRAEEIVPELRALGVRWLVRDPGIAELYTEGRAADALALDLVAALGDRAALVFRSRDRGHFVYRLDWAGAAAAD